MYQGLQIINNGNCKSSSLATRKEPLYHNCYLQAPDGETLCTCDRKKAEWYVSKRLDTVVGENLFTVRLNFEPSGRASGQVGQYYSQIKVNQCVVCEANKNFIKKNVVPREYRKYFPCKLWKTLLAKYRRKRIIVWYNSVNLIAVVMKAHQSHDVLLLSPNCHEVSNRHDLDLRRQLADMCDAPLARPTTHGRGNFNVGPTYAGRDQRESAKFFSAVKALRDEPPTIPPRRRKQLETQILKFTGQREMSQGLLNCLYEQYKNQPPVIEMSSPQQMRCQPHGMKVIYHLIEFLYFTMQPKSEKSTILKVSITFLLRNDNCKKSTNPREKKSIIRKVFYPIFYLLIKSSLFDMFSSEDSTATGYTYLGSRKLRDFQEFFYRFNKYLLNFTRHYQKVLIFRYMGWELNLKQ